MTGHDARCCVISVIVMIMMVAVLPASASDGTRAERAEQLTLAHDAYDAGIKALSDDRARARRRFEEAAARYRDLARGSGNAAPSILYNLGNAELLAGEVGRAVVAYQRGLDRRPRDAALNENLDAARARANERGAPPPPALSSLHASHRLMAVFPERARLWIFLGLFALTWSLAIWRLLHQTIRPDRWVVGAAGAAAALMLGTLLLDEAARSTDRRAVVASQTRTFDGLDDATFGQANTEPLPSGTELLLLETRDVWSRVRLGDEREAWVTSADLEWLRPRDGT